MFDDARRGDAATRRDGQGELFDEQFFSLRDGDVRAGRLAELAVKSKSSDIKMTFASLATCRLVSFSDPEIPSRKRVCQCIKMYHNHNYHIIEFTFGCSTFDLTENGTSSNIYFIYLGMRFGFLRLY